MATPFQNCVIALTGKFPETHGKIAASIKSNGGKHSTKVAEDVTHLIVSAADIENESGKVQQAREVLDIKVVSYDWLLASVNHQARADEARFLLRPLTTSIQPDSNIKGKNIKGKKRARSETPAAVAQTKMEDNVDQPPTKKYKDGQKAKSRSVQIPVDESCPLAGHYSVYIDNDGTIYDAALNQANAGDNHNKFYRIQLLVSPSGNYKTWTRWGRVGNQGDNKIFGTGTLHDARLCFEQKFKEKAGNTWANRLEPRRTDTKKPFYTFIERKYKDDSSDDEGSSGISKHARSASPVKKAKSSLPKQVQRLMELIFNQQFFANAMREMDYDAEKLPLGQLSRRTMQKGIEILKEIEELFSNPALADEKHNMTFERAIEECSNAYYTMIPHVFGMRRVPVIATEELLRKEVTLLDSLSDMEIANTIMKDTGEDASINVLDRQFSGLGLQEMTPLEPWSGEFKCLEEYLIKTRGWTHSYKFKVQDIFRVERNGEDERFKTSPFAQLDRSGLLARSDRRLLWHGSRVTNFGGILSQGLRIAPPEAPMSGYAFGKGLYLADISSKSANYCHSEASGNTGLLLLCEVELGKPMLELGLGQYDAPEVAKGLGFFSCMGKGATTPLYWRDASCVNPNLAGVMMPNVEGKRGSIGPGPHTDFFLQYNEYIAYDVAQVRIRYLFRVGMTRI